MSYDSTAGAVDVTFVAGGAITQYTLVKMSADNTVVACAAVTDVPIGVAQDGAVNVGDAVSVRIVGLSKVVASAAIAAGVPIGTSATGTAVAETIGTDTTHYVAGICVAASTAASEILTAAINCAQPSRAA